MVSLIAPSCQCWSVLAGATISPSYTPGKTSAIIFFFIIIIIINIIINLRTCFAFVWLEVIASRSKLLSQHSSVNGIKICVTTIGAPCSILRLNATSSLSELFACIRPVAKAACISICSRFQLEATFFQFFYSIKDSHDTVPHAAETLASETRP